MAYSNTFYAFSGSASIPVTIRNYVKADIPGLIELQKASFPPPFSEELWWSREQLVSHIDTFPDGAFCAEVDGVIIGSTTALRVMLQDDDLQHTWEDITDNGYIRNHEPNGNTLYIVDICIHPHYRQYKIGKQLMQAHYQLVVQQQIRRLLGGGRMPHYSQYASAMSAEAYVEQVVNGHIYDPVITFLLRAGRMPVAIVENYLDDEESKNYGVLMEWKNPFLS